MPAPKISPALAAALASSGRDPSTVSASTETTVVAAGAAPVDPPAGASGAANPAAVTETTTEIQASAGATGAAADATAPGAVVATGDGTGGGAQPAAAAPGQLEPQLVTYLQGELRTANDRVTALTVDLTAARAQVATVPGMETAMRLACTRLAVGLGESSAAIASLSGQPLLDTFTRLNTELEKRYPVGQKTTDHAASQANASASAVAPRTTQHRAGISATSLPGAKKK